jgi:hippurate hydrolase
MVNAIADGCAVGGTVRAGTSALRQQLLDAVLRVAEGCAQAHACRLEHQHEIIYPATVNEAACAAKAAAAISDIWGDACLWTDGMPIMGAEDFSYYLEQKPGAYLLLGAGRDGQEVYPCHSSKFDYNDDLIPIVTALWSRLAGLEDSDHG